MEKEKILSIISYIGPLFLISLLLEKDNTNVKFHVNQGAVLFIFDLVCTVACWVLSIIPFIGGAISTLAGLVILVLMVIGIINAWNEENKELPVIGGISIIK